MKGCLLFISLFIGAVLANDILSPTPSIIEPKSRRTLYIPNGGGKNISCIAQGRGVKTYKWFRDGKQVESEKNRAKETLISFDSQSGDLTLVDFSKRFNGDYQCVASIGDAASLSQIQTLYEIRFPHFIASSTEVTKTVNQYDYAMLECSNQGKIVADPNDIRYNWYLSSKSKDVDKDGGRLFIDSQGNLHFTFVKLSDATDPDKMFLCGYSSSVLKSIYLGNNNLMSVKMVSNAESTKPRSMGNNGPVQVLIGQNARLECVFSGYDRLATNHLPTIQWMNNKKNVVSGNNYTLSFNNRVLTVKNINDDTDRYYYCEGSTSVGSSGEVAVLLNVTSPPIWVKGPKAQWKTKDQEATFHCKAKSASGENPPEKPQWFINGKEFTSSFDHTKYILSSNQQMMTIKRLRANLDNLCVQCVVKNSVGSIMGDACLTVLAPITITMKPPAVQEVKKGGKIWLTFKATRDPTAPDLVQVFIYKNVTYNNIEKVPHVIYDSKNRTYLIDTRKLSQEEFENVDGVYTCRFYNLYYDPVDINTEIKLQEGIVPGAATASAGIDMWIIGLIVGLLFFIIVIAIIIFVICRKQLEGDYNVDKKETGAGLDPEKELRDKGFNDLSRPEYDDYDYPEKKPRGDLEFDDGPIGDDESLGEYGDEEDTHFNEDGSFIGIYQKKENERQNHKNESTI